MIMQERVFLEFEVIALDLALSLQELIRSGQISNKAFLLELLMSSFLTFRPGHEVRNCPVQFPCLKMRTFSPKESELPKFLSKLFKAFHNLPPFTFHLQCPSFSRTVCSHHTGLLDNYLQGPG